jgi:hypothetical protein
MPPTAVEPPNLTLIACNIHVSYRLSIMARFTRCADVLMTMNIGLIALFMFGLGLAVPL